MGLWEAGPGTDTDVKVDEVFLVLAGAGTVTFDDGSSLALAPGVVVLLVTGDRTTWTITDRLRKPSGGPFRSQLLLTRTDGTGCGLAQVPF